MSQFQPPESPFGQPSSQPLPSGQQPQWGQQPPQPLPPQQPGPQTGYGQWQQPQYPPQQGYGPPQWQQSQQYPQQPVQSMPPQQPKKKSNKTLFIVLGIIAAVIVFGCVGISALVAAGGKAGQNAVNQASTEIATTAAEQPTQASKPGQSSNVIGKPVQSGSWVVTLNSVSTSHGDQYNVPKSGHIYLVVNVTLKNTLDKPQTASSLLMFALKDSTGQKYDENITMGNSPDGDVAASGLIRGQIVYEVPTAINDFTLQFDPNFDVSLLVEWSIKD